MKRNPNNRTSPVTPFERAQLLLDAFDKLEGWGFVQPDGRIKKWDMTQRQREAVALVDWALTS